MPNWNILKTKHGLHADEVISALQKSIRRGNEEDAVFFAYELMVSGQDFAEKFWQRLKVISVEDIGLANPTLVVTIDTLYNNYQLLKGKGDSYLQGLFGTLLLVRSPKSRYVDELYNNIKRKVEDENYRREIPDYAIDKHTEKGERLGRGDLHFWEVASALVNDIHKEEKKHLTEIINRIKKNTL